MNDEFPADLLDRITTTAAAAGDTTAALAAITPALTELRRRLDGMRFIGPPRLVGYCPPPPSRGEISSRTADRLRHAVRSLHCARAFGTADDARRVIDEALRDVRVAAVGHAGMTTPAVFRVTS